MYHVLFHLQYNTVQYSLDEKLLKFSGDSLSSELLHSKGDANLFLNIYFFNNGAARVRITEAAERWQVIYFIVLGGRLQ